MIWQVWFGKPKGSDLARPLCRITVICVIGQPKHLAQSLFQGVIWQNALPNHSCREWFGIWLGVIWQNVTQSQWLGNPKGSDLVWFGNNSVCRIRVIWHSKESDLALQGEWFGIFRRVIWSESLVIWMIWHLVGLGDSSWVIPWVLSYLALCRITNHSVIWWFGKRFRFFAESLITQWLVIWHSRIT